MIAKTYDIKKILFRIVISVVFIAILYALITGGDGGSSLFIVLAYTLYYGVPLYFINKYFYALLSKKYSWYDNAREKIVLGIIGSLTITMVALVALNYILWVWYYGQSTDILFQDMNVYYVALLISVFISALIHSGKFYKEVIQQKNINNRLVQEKLKTELYAIKAHIDPHFLFNSFNILSGLIEEDPAKAQKLLNELSGIYRYILENRDKELKSVEEEIAFSRKYLGLHQARFEDSITLDVDVDPIKMSKELPSLSLQLLLENAIKHNAFDQENPLHITISSDQDKLIVQNNKRQRKQLVVGSGLGLKNINDRYKLLNASEIKILDKEDSFTVILPLL